MIGCMALRVAKKTMALSTSSQNRACPKLPSTRWRTNTNVARRQGAASRKEDDGAEHEQHDQRMSELAIAAAAEQLDRGDEDVEQVLPAGAGGGGGRARAHGSSG